MAFNVLKCCMFTISYFTGHYFLQKICKCLTNQPTKGFLPHPICNLCSVLFLRYFLIITFRIISNRRIRSKRFRTSLNLAKKMYKTIHGSLKYFISAITIVLHSVLSLKGLVEGGSKSTLLTSTSFFCFHQHARVCSYWRKENLSSHSRPNHTCHLGRCK